MCQKKIIFGDLESEEFSYNVELFEQIVKRYRNLMLAYCGCRFSRIDRSDAEDLVTDVFMEIQKAVLEGVREKDAPIEAVLFVYLRWRCLSHVEKLKRDSVAISSLNKEASEDIEDITSLSPEDYVMYEEFRRAVIECVNNLPEKQRKVVVMYWEGFKQYEIAEELGVSRPRVNYIVNQQVPLGLQRCLEDAGFEEEVQNLFEEGNFLVQIRG